MIAHVCQSTGWTWDYVLAEMTLPRLAAFIRIWRRRPPVDVMLAALLGLGAEDGRRGDPGELVAMFGDTGNIC